MTRRFRLGLAASLTVAVLACLAGAAYYASPYWAVHRLKQAAQERDVDAVMAQVDQQALERSVRQALGLQLNVALYGGRTEGARTLPDGAPEAAAARMDAVSRTFAEPTAVMSMLIQGYPSSAITGVAALSRARLSAIEAGEGEGGGWKAQVRYIDRRTVEVRSERMPGAGAFVLSRSGWWNWKLSGFDTSN